MGMTGMHFTKQGKVWKCSECGAKGKYIQEEAGQRLDGRPHVRTDAYCENCGRLRPKDQLVQTIAKLEIERAQALRKAEEFQKLNPRVAHLEAKLTAALKDVGQLSSENAGLKSNLTDAVGQRGRLAERIADATDKLLEAQKQRDEAQAHEREQARVAWDLNMKLETALYLIDALNSIMNAKKVQDEAHQFLYDNYKKSGKHV